MRISDWSSDVCSSDLRLLLVPDVITRRHHVGAGGVELGADFLGDAEAAGGVLAIDHGEIERKLAAQPRQMLHHHLAARPARKSVVEGKSVSVRVDLGGHRRIKQTQTPNTLART